MFRFLMLVLASCAAIAVISSATSIAADKQKIEDKTHPVIGQLELRSRRVTITASPHGSLYSIADQSGTVLSAALTEDRLAEEYPELYELLQPAVANQDIELMMLAPWDR